MSGAKLLIINNWNPLKRIDHFAEIFWNIFITGQLISQTLTRIMLP